MIDLLKENVKRYRAAVALVRKMKRPTYMSLQNRFCIGYGTAMNLVDVMKERGDWPR